MGISLVMIVRDEAAVLPRCLASVQGLVSSWVICDTGSSDATLEIAESMLTELAGKAVSFPFHDFGQARTDALRALRNFTRADEWALMLDADCTVEWHPDFLPWLETDPDPSVDAWMVGVQDHGMFYRLPLLVRSRVAWEYVGRTHEYLAMDGLKDRSLLGLTIHHHGDGSRHTVKLEHDLELLREGYEEGEPRATFYMAETLRYLGRLEESRDIYLERVGMRGFAEEVWYSCYQAAKIDKDVDALIEAWHFRPWRPEPLRAAAAIVAEIEHDDRLFLES